MPVLKMQSFSWLCFMTLRQHERAAASIAWDTQHKICELNRSERPYSTRAGHRPHPMFSRPAYGSIVVHHSGAPHLSAYKLQRCRIGESRMALLF